MGLTNVVGFFTLLFKVILGLSGVAYNLGTMVPSIFVWSKKHEYDFDRCISK
jgi:hypothetical protein